MHKQAMVANLLVEILGGSKAVAMTGCTFVLVNAYEVQMRGIKPGKKIKDVLVKYNPATDLFDVQFMRYSPKKLELVKVDEVVGVYVGQLRSLVESKVGVSLSL